MEENIITKNNCFITLSQKGVVIQQQNKNSGVVYILLMTATISIAIILILNSYLQFLNNKSNFIEIINLFLIALLFRYKNFPKRELIPYHFIEKIAIMNSVQDSMTIVKIDTKPGYKYIFQYKYPDLAEWDNIIAPLAKYNDEMPLEFKTCTFNLEEYK